ncbi:hypothetical protein CJF42_05755 [Pseudoalteromonas sp. NBT06-2]|uniref:winged helix-turn-helix domain-containing protein n=1 Tax=Pseudoalteromonas sp. NBT06-2 TaxID=2025950 RepID=UPI000BA64150|nr:winged helix-turn-helix domain-containing protein [Pseudoalteromonas sp. NBT06-2]PAJ75346.1 hypothetical protein CJF42_05755 [Pseudoalteromonas sp. NBT06-2]
MEYFRLGDSLVDVKRCKITRNEKVISVEPKVMDMLRLLCEHLGEVVSQQRLHETLWPGTTFNNSSILRCISLLRKALGEKASNSSIIITHPKRGYSIDIPIEAINDKSKKENNRYKKISVIAPLLITLCLLGLYFIQIMDVSNKPQSYSLTPLTSNSNNEYLPSYSSNGSYIAFVRESDSGQQHIIVKNLITESEILINGIFSNIKSLSWAYQDNGLTLVYKRGKMNHIALYAFNPISKKMTQESQLLFTSVDDIISRVEWISDNEFVIAVKSKGKDFSIIKRNLSKNSTEILYQYTAPLLEIIDIALSEDKQNLAIAVSEKANLYRIDLYDLISSNRRKLIHIDNGIHSLSWQPSNESLLISSREKLFNISLDGKIAQIPFSNYKIVTNAFYAKNSNKILMELANYDIDILEFKPEEQQKLTKVIDTEALDVLPLYSPSAKRFVYQTSRRGFPQLIINEAGREQVLFINPEHEELFGFTWSPDGNKVALATTSQLYIFDANTALELTKEALEYKIYIRDWFNKDHALLVNLIKDGMPKPAKLYLESRKIETLADMIASCSALDLNDNIYFNNNNQIFKIDNNKLISKLWYAENGHVENILITDKNALIEVNLGDNNKLWVVDLKSSLSKQVYQDLDSKLMISDITQNEEVIMFHSPLSAKKEIALLTMEYKY